MKSLLNALAVHVLHVTGDPWNDMILLLIDRVLIVCHKFLTSSLKFIPYMISYHGLDFFGTEILAFEGFCCRRPSLSSARRAEPYIFSSSKVITIGILSYRWTKHNSRRKH